MTSLQDESFLNSGLVDVAVGTSVLVVADLGEDPDAKLVKTIAVT